MFSPKRLQLERVTVLREQDEWENGCQPGTIERNQHPVGLGLVFEDAEEMFEHIQEMTGIYMPMEDIAKQVSQGAVGSGTIQLQCHVTDFWEYPTPEQFENWKNGSETLWLCDILLQVSLVQRNIDSNDLERFIEMDLMETSDEDWAIN